MTAEERGTQVKVGIFMAIGLAAVGLMVVYFGRFGDSVRNYYDLRVEYPNAAGIYKGASVLLAGAKIGMVDTPPVILKDLDGVAVGLKIYEDVKIPEKAEFTIGSSGLLGDKFIQIIIPEGAKDSPPFPPDATIVGHGEKGFEDITEQAGVLLADIQKAIGNINAIAEKLNSDVFKKSTMEDLNATMANLRETSASFADASKKIDDVVENAKGAIKTGEQTMVSAKEAADELKKTITDVRSIVQQTKQGRGALGMLLSDKEVADNLRALVINLRRHGILWYKDRANQPEPARR